MQLTVSITRWMSWEEMPTKQHTSWVAKTRRQAPMSNPSPSKFSEALGMLFCLAKARTAASAKLRFTSGNTAENLRFLEEHFGKPWNEREEKDSSQDPCGECMVACVFEWGHNQTMQKWSEHPAAEYEYNIKVSEFLMYAGVETLFLGSNGDGSHTILYFTLRQNDIIAKGRRKYTPFPSKQRKRQNRKERQEANRKKGKAKGFPKGQGRVRGKEK